MSWRSLILLGAGLLSMQAWSEGFPKGCEPRDYQFSHQHLILNETGQQRLFVIYNHTSFPVRIQRYQTQSFFMGPSLSVNLGAGEWSAFATDLRQMQLECRMPKGEQTYRVDCGQYLAVCEYPRAKFPVSNMGNYWVAANKPQREVINEAAAKGIYLHW